jgi:hypothetical protein
VCPKVVASPLRHEHTVSDQVALEKDGEPPYELVTLKMQMLMPADAWATSSAAADASTALLALAAALASASLRLRQRGAPPLPATHPLTTLAQLAMHVPLLRLRHRGAEQPLLQLPQQPQLPLQLQLQLAAAPLSGAAAAAAAAALQLCCLARRVGGVGCSPEQLPEWANAAAAAALTHLFPHFAASRALFAGGSAASASLSERLQAVYSVLLAALDACRSLSTTAACLTNLLLPSPEDDDGLTSTHTILAFACIAAIHACQLLHVLYQRPGCITTPASCTTPLERQLAGPSAFRYAPPATKSLLDKSLGLFAELLAVLGVRSKPVCGR